jgi:hypothetical protein
MVIKEQPEADLSLKVSFDISLSEFFINNRKHVKSWVLFLIPIRAYK